MTGAIDTLVCLHCGVRSCGEHPTPADCICALREVLANYEMRMESMKLRIPKKRFVLVDGARMPLSRAAAQLGISRDALRMQLVRSLGSERWDAVDVRKLLGGAAGKGRAA